MARSKGDVVKISAAVATLAAAGAVFYFFGREEPVVPEDINFVCVETGETFNLDRDNVGRIPMKNPKTGKTTLFPCVQREGSLYVSSRYRGALDTLQAENRYVDAKSLQVKKTP